MENIGLSEKIISLLNKTLGMQSLAQIIHICHYVLETEPLGGVIVAFGCYAGDTAKVITELTNRPVHVYDSFQGLPDHNGYMQMPKKILIENFKYDRVKLPHIHEGWFNELKPEEVPDQISFAHLDGDLYESIKDSLFLVYDKMIKDGIILIDDYDHPRFPGVRKAVNEFMINKPEEIRFLNEIPHEVIAIGSKAYIKKL